MDVFWVTAELVGDCWRVDVPDVGEVETPYLSRIEDAVCELIAEHRGLELGSFRVRVRYLTRTRWTDPDGTRWSAVRLGR
ncbi:hypothetical protein IU418_26515 [Nocardia farcinica]|uniref:hypothetical protein n=1 Tax=Nocardia farcinica TaxID=37329 RepID=UPI0009CA8448|nr:hypothetical protein [Nocardia farcinica]MBF6540765.1 hypothetical protein [Nocardia farcinica]SLG32873.1 Uncharacterised protein [Mycobacteroides abscessus subsp. abscessus]